MYIIDFLKCLGRRSNITTCIYLVLNILLIGGIVTLFLGAYGVENYGIGFLIGLGLYIVSMLIALSPIGEWILRMQTGCKKIRRHEQLDILMPAFQEVYDKARREEPSISEEIQLYISEEEDANAFATGRKTICVTKGLLALPQDQIKAILGHEFGHLAHKDTDIILVVAVGNMIVNFIIFLIKSIIELVHLVYLICIWLTHDREDAFFSSIVLALYNFLIMAIVGGLTWLWTQLGVLLCMKSSRGNEFEADAFSYKLGYGKELCEALDAICGSDAKGLFATLSSSHPSRDDRIGALQDLMYGVYLINGDKDDIHGISKEDDKHEIPKEDDIHGISKEDDKRGISKEDDIHGISKEDDKREIQKDDDISSKNRVEKKTVYTGQAKIRCLAGQYEGMVIEINDNENIVIGRDPSAANLVLQNEYISRSHCIIRYDKEKNVFLVMDASSYGTYLGNGLKMTPNTYKELPDETILLLGNKQEQFLLEAKTRGVMV
jgi:heat shock protein HtpX